MRPLTSKVNTKIAGKVDNRHRVVRGVNFKPAKGHPMRPMVKRLHNGTTAMPRPNMDRTPRPRFSFQKYPVKNTRRITSKAVDRNPAKWIKKVKPAEGERRKAELYHGAKLLGTCEIIQSIGSRHSRVGMVRHQVAIDGRIVGWAMSVGNHLKLLRVGK